MPPKRKPLSRLHPAIDSNIMGRPSRIFAILATISLTLCVSTIATWSLGPLTPSWFANWPDKPVTTHRLYVGTWAGYVVLCLMEPGFSTRQQLREFFGVQSEFASAYSRVGGTNVHIGTVRFLMLPHWVIALATAVLPSRFALSAIRYRRRIEIGHCPK